MKILSIKQLMSRWGVSRQRVHQITRHWHRESPCKRCGSLSVMVREADVKEHEKKRKQK